MNIIMQSLALHHASDNNLLKKTEINTLLGSITIITDSNYLYFLDFTNRGDLTKKIHKLIHAYPNILYIKRGITPVTELIEYEINSYLSGTLQQFQTPFQLNGTVFQKSVWEELCKIPYAKTISYREQAIALEKPNSYRAVANANNANPLAIIVPCHRVITSHGAIGGYGGGTAIKSFLLNLEQSTLHKQQISEFPIS